MTTTATRKGPTKATGKSAGRRQITVPLTEVKAVDGHNPRTTISTKGEAFKELVESIKAHGLLQPILVGPKANGAHPLIAGERRWRACKAAGLKEIPAVEADLDGAELEAAIAENVVRENLSPLEEAEAIGRLREERGLRQVDIAKALHKSERWVRDREKLLSLPDSVRKALDAGKVPLEAQAVLSKISTLAPMACEKLVAWAIDEGWARDLAKETDVAEALGGLAKDGKLGLQRIGGRYDYYGVPAAKLAVSDEDRKELAKAHKEIPARYGQRPGFKFGPADAKAAKARGALLTLKTGTSWEPQIQFLTDPELIAERARAKLKTLHAEAKKHEKDEAQHQQSRDHYAAEREREKKRREKAREQARNAARKLGEPLAELRIPKGDVEAARLVCAMALGEERDVMDTVKDGLAMCDPTYEALGEGKPLSDRLIGELAAATTVEACLAVTLRAHIACRFAREEHWQAGVVPGPQGHNPPGLHAQGALDALADRLLALPPNAKAKMKKAAKERGQRAR